MEIQVLYLRSDNANRQERDKRDLDYISQLSELSHHELILQPAVPKQELTMVYVSGGGVEGDFVKIADQLQDPVFILTLNENNSLAASMEMLCYLQQQRRTGEIIHGSPEHTAQRIDRLVRCFETKTRLKGMRFGCIGKPSDWLIASKVDPIIAKKACGIELVEIDMQEMFEEIERHEYEENQYTRMVQCQGYDAKEMRLALDIYGAVKRIVQRYQLQAVSIRCFDLLVPIHSTGCLALAILNAEGIYAGCEGDMTSLLSMAILGMLSKKPVFLCNPSRILSDQDIIFAHCTLPITMPTAFHFMTHYESDLGVALAGRLKEGPCTVFKCSQDLRQHFVQAGEIVENLHESHLCRTQIHVRLQDTTPLLKHPICNHHLIVLGDDAALIEEFFHWI